MVEPTVGQVSYTPLTFTFKDHEYSIKMSAIVGTWCLYDLEAKYYIYPPWIFDEHNSQYIELINIVSPWTLGRIDMSLQEYIDKLGYHHA